MSDEDDRKLFIGGTKNADEGVLEEYFGGFGQIESCKGGFHDQVVAE
jgi:hypothetical protein